ncbi:MAG: acetyl-CoA carboxylase biotin carboxyl carrier protein [Planctomycetaceae bacterium]
MADSKTSPEGFDLERLQQLVELMEKHDLREVKLKKGGEQWKLRRGPQEVMQAIPMSAPMMSHAPAVAPQPATVQSAPSASAAPAPVADLGKTINSPMVGTFYRSPSPEDPVFVKEGDRVSSDTVVCLIEAMKFFNQVKAECGGVISKILVNDGDAVEYGQPLFAIRDA